jgi:hypothetical protein
VRFSTVAPAWPVALASTCILADAVAAARTPAECKQEFAARKAAGATAGQSEASDVRACLAADPPPAGAEASQGGDDVNKLREAAQNPVADLISVPFQDDPAFIYGRYTGTRNVLNIQPGHSDPSQRRLEPSPAGATRS